MQAWHWMVCVHVWRGPVGTLTREWGFELSAAAAEALMPRLVFRPGDDSGHPGLALMLNGVPRRAGRAR